MTVSNVLNDRGSFTEATRAEVLAAMQRLNYRPNAMARGMNRKPMNTLGVVLPNAFQAPTSHPYYSLVLAGIMDAAVELHLDVITYTGSLWTEGGSSIATYHDGRSDGVILVAPYWKGSLIPALTAADVSFVCIGDYFEQPEVSCVFVDDVGSEEMLVDYLVEQGHRRIAMLRGEEIVQCVGRRAEGYRRSLIKHGLEPKPSFDLRGGFEEGTIAPRVENLAALPPAARPTAICTTNDEMALTAVAVLRRIGLRVPEDVSVVGFDDTRDSGAAHLTTMRQPIREIAHRAACVLKGMLSGELEGPQKEAFETELVIRGSVTPPAS
jgi:LacI family transcriptional regulator